jgi:hypothetical protein
MKLLFAVQQISVTNKTDKTAYYVHAISSLLLRSLNMFFVNKNSHSCKETNFTTKLHILHHSRLNKSLLRIK